MLPVTLTTVYVNSAVNCKVVIHSAKVESVTISLTSNCTHVFSILQLETVVRFILQGIQLKCFRRIMLHCDLIDVVRKRGFHKIRHRKYINVLYNYITGSTSFRLSSS